MLKRPGSLRVVERRRIVHHLEFLHRFLRCPVPAFEQQREKNLVANQFLAMTLLFVARDRAEEFFELFARRLIVMLPEWNARQVMTGVLELRIGDKRVAKSRFRFLLLPFFEQNLAPQIVGSGLVRRRRVHLI